MLDIKLIRENTDAVRQNIKKRNNPEYEKILDSAVKLDKERRELIQKVDTQRQERNEITKSIAGLKAKRGFSNEMKKAKAVSSEISKLEEKLIALDGKMTESMMNLPNMLHESVPVGKDDKDNVVMRTEGIKPEISEPKGHVELLQNLGMLDLERAAKVAGRGFYYLKGDAVILDMALQRFALDFLKKKGFTVVEPPLMLNEEIFRRVTDWETFNTQAYKLEGHDLRTIGTAEHPIGAMLSDEILLKNELPVLMAGVSPCFRREVGAHGKYTRGLFRVHHFNKVEQFVFCVPQDSWEWHEKLQKNAEELYRKLELHYRVVNVCTGDIGTIAAKKYDIEIWMADGEFREAGSNSNCTDYQARRLGIRYREKEGTAVKGFVHTLNNTALATSRIMIAIIEQFQQTEGSVVIPKALQPYCGFESLTAD